MNYYKPNKDGVHRKKTNVMTEFLAQLSYNQILGGWTVATGSPAPTVRRSSYR